MSQSRLLSFNVQADALIKSWGRILVILQLDARQKSPDSGSDRPCALMAPDLRRVRVNRHLKLLKLEIELSYSK